MPDIFVAEEKKEEPKKKKKIRKIRTQLDLLENRASSFLAAFVPRPDGLRFQTQDQKEKIVLLLRRHPITNVPWLALALLMIAAPFLVLNLFSWEGLAPSYRFISVLFWYLLTLAVMLQRFLIWYFNVNIITDERVVDIDFPHLLYRHIAETKIDKIQNVNSRTGGYIRSLFNYGDVLIQSAEAVPQITFEAIPNPEQVSLILNELILEEEQEKLDGRVR